MIAQYARACGTCNELVDVPITTAAPLYTFMAGPIGPIDCPNGLQQKRLYYYLKKPIYSCKISYSNLWIYHTDNATLRDTDSKQCP